MTSRATFSERPRRRPGPVTLLALATVLAGPACGKRGDPLPPLRRTPAAGEGLVAVQRAGRIELLWRAPETNTDGSRDVRLREAEVWRRVVDAPRPKPAAREGTAPGEEPSGAEGPAEPAEEEIPPEAPGREERAPTTAVPPFPEGASVVATVPVAAPGEPLRYAEPVDPSWIGRRVDYAVRHRNRSGRAGPLSAVASLEPVPPLSAPEGLEAEAAGGAVRLRWRQVSPPAEGLVLGYEVLRRDEGAEGDRIVTEGPVEAPRFDDPAVDYGRHRCYRVRAVALGRRTAEGETLPLVGRVESAPTEPVCLAPVDTFAPPPPGGLVAVAAANGILLSWETVPAPDLAGYHVYRAARPEGPFERRTAEPLRAATWTDETAEPEVEYVYAVTAVDRAGNESDRGPTARAVRRR